MADTLFVAQVTRIAATWLNQINNALFKGQSPNYAVTTGSANAQVLTLAVGSLYTSPADGDTFTFKAGFTNTAAMTLQIIAPAGTLPAVALEFNGAALSGGEIVAGMNYTVIRSGATWQLFTVGAAQIGTKLDAPGAVARTQHEKNAEIVSVLDFYANGVSGVAVDPTGVVDSTLGIQAAIDATFVGANPNSGNKVVFFPPGVYLISDALSLKDYQSLIGAGRFSSVIKGTMTSKSYIRSQYGESPTVGQRPTGLYIGHLSIQPASIGAGSIGINYKNSQYSILDDVFITNVDTGLVTDQVTQYCKFSRVTVQVANTGALLDSTGGANSIESCDFGGNTVSLDIASGSWDLSNVSAEALTTGTTYCLRLGRSGGANTTVTANGLYLEGLDASTVSIQIEDSVTRTSIQGIHRHGTLGSVVNNAGTEVLIEAPGQGYYTPLYRAQRIEFASSVDGAAQASLRSNGGNTIEARNAANTGFADVFARAVIPATNTITYSTSMTPDALAGRTQIITVADGVAFTINAPANPVAGARITLLIRNGSGGAVGAITWNAIYKMSAWTSPANNFSRSISFEYQNTVWAQISQTGADIPL